MPIAVARVRRRGGKRYRIADPEWDDVRAILDARNVKIGALVDRGLGLGRLLFGLQSCHVSGTFRLPAVVRYRPA
jgi:hypothetical protein